ncbi:uncharacterized protein DFL_004818 [Arthrobotrys flagrans]|uniref:Uncharacterized protein n=1 Tax=Arthrobotrys flagrans TaxID=97331 RepID=A0A437A5Z1_ARTFL|nr:hypothetical protein DFL_004818 [Arthrobotrys flagrans]
MAPDGKFKYFVLLFATLASSVLVAPPSEMEESSTPAPSSGSNFRITFVNLTTFSLTTQKVPPPTAVINGENPQRETSSTINSISPSKRTDAPINPNIFYSIRGTVQCPTSIQIRDMDGDPDHYETFFFSPQRRPKFNTRGGNPTSRATLHSRRVGWIEKCMNCDCDSNTGRLVPEPLGAFRPSDSSGRRFHCKDETPRKCENWLNCFCVFEMQQPPRFREVTVEEYQDALNRIPDRIKSANPGYTWKPSLGWEMTWGTGQYGSGSGQATHRELVPGTKEPYYLEGPSDEDPRMRGWPGNFYSGGKFASPFGESSYVPRENLEKRDEEKKGEEKRV